MLITFSNELTAPDWYSDPEATVKGVASNAGVWAAIVWARNREVRFTLHKIKWANAIASSDQHDQVIRALLTLDPHAKVRTARAVYEGLADYEAQLAARVG